MHAVRRLLAIFAFLSLVTVVGVLRASADDPPLPPLTNADVFTDAPEDQGPTVSVEATCDYMAVYFHATTQAPLDGLTLSVSVDGGQWTTLPPGQTAIRFDGRHAVAEGRIADDHNNSDSNIGQVLDQMSMANTTECVTAPPTS